MPPAKCLLSCTGISNCFYNSGTFNGSSTARLDLRYCCYDDGDQVNYCCDDSSLGIFASAADNAPPECYSSSWTYWRVMALILGITAILTLVSIFCRTLKRWRLSRLQHDSSRMDDASVNESSDTAVNNSTTDYYITRTSANLSSNNAPTDLSMTSVDLQLPPCYESLQPPPFDYDKSLPPSYTDVIQTDQSSVPGAVYLTYSVPSGPVTANVSNASSAHEIGHQTVSTTPANVDHIRTIAEEPTAPEQSVGECREVHINAAGFENLAVDFSGDDVNTNPASV